jgi:hypothetical protein
VKRLTLFGLIALATAASTSVASSFGVVEMKVKIYATPEQVARIAPDVLEFYGVGDGWLRGH